MIAHTDGCENKPTGGKVTSETNQIAELEVGTRCVFTEQGPQEDWQNEILPFPRPSSSIKLKHTKESTVGIAAHLGPSNQEAAFTDNEKKEPKVDVNAKDSTIGQEARCSIFKSGARTQQPLTTSTMPLVSTRREDDVPEDDGSDDEPMVSLRTIIRDALLSGVDSDGPPPEDISGCSLPASEHPPMLRQQSSISSIQSEPGLSEHGFYVGMLTADIIGEDVDLNPLEKRLIYYEIHGRHAPDIQLMEERIDDLEREIWRLPREDKAALLRVLRKKPLLFVVSSHAKLFLRAEDYDPKRAAQRLTRYWTVRERFFGEDGALRDGDVLDAKLDDYVRFYERSELVLENPHADDVEKEIAREYISCVNSAKVASMNRCLVETLTNHKDVFHMVEECKLVQNTNGTSPEVAGTDEQKMLFIRCEKFLAEKAMGRMMKYWSRKIILFGPNLAAKDVTLCDMEDCWEVLNLGFIRIMPGADKHGRVVLVFTMKILSEVLDDLSDEEGELRIMKTIWYVLNAALEQKNCQRNGIVFLANLREGNTDILRRFKLRAACRDILMRCVPLRIKAFHFFFPPSQSWWQSAIYAVFKQAEPLYKKHAVIHAGSSQELELSELAQCGIAPSELPSELGGTVPLDYYKDWLDDRKAKGL